MKKTILKKIGIVSGGQKAVEKGQNFFYTKKILEDMTNLSAVVTKKVFLSSDLNALDKVADEAANSDNVDYNVVDKLSIGTVVKAYVEKNMLYIDVKLNDSKLFDKLGTVVSGGFSGTTSECVLPGEVLKDLKVHYFYLNIPTDDKSDAVNK